MKTRKEKKTACLAGKVVKGFAILKTNELMQIRGGGESIPIDEEID